MFKSYLKTAVRSLLKNKLTTFINIFGLGLSMSVGLMILIRTQDALSYDQFTPNREKIYRITSEYSKRSGDRWEMASTPLPLLDNLDKSTVVEDAINIYPALNGRATGNGKEIVINGAFTQSSFFSMFGLTLMEGNAATALNEPNTIVLSKSTAEKFFGNANPVGKILQFDNGSTFLITGVLSAAPGKFHLNYEAYASSSSIAQMEIKKTLSEKSSDWFAFNAGYTYVRLQRDAHPPALQVELNRTADHLNKLNNDGICAFHMQPFKKITPGITYLNNDNAGGTSWTKIYAEAGIALLILLAACFNYTNLTIARALTRAKEVGIRKMMGAKRFQVFVQYIFESVLLSIFSLIFAGLILYLIVHYAPFNDDYEFIPSSFRYNTRFIVFSLLYAVFAGLVAGSAPAWILSAFKSVRVLKNLSTAKILGKVSLQKTLIVFQYSLSLVVIVFLFVFYKQFAFMAKTEPGFKRDHLIIVPLNDINEQIVTQKLSSVRGVKAISASSANFTKRFSGMSSPFWLSSRKNAIGLNYYYADNSFISLMQFSLLAGTNFPGSVQSDNEQYILLNEKAAQAFGFANPAKAVGEKLWLNDSTRLEIKGVLKDFRYESAGRSIDPLAFRIRKNACTNLYIETTAGVDKEGIENRIKAALASLGTTQPVTISWLTDDLKEANSQTATISLLGFLGFIALTVATLGLLGLVVYTVQVKGKEISIRKIAGASELQIVKILSKGFIKLLFIAGFIAMPIGWFLARMFVQNFAERTPFTFINVFMCFLFLLSIGLFTIISQTFKAAISNPVKSLRTE